MSSEYIPVKTLDDYKLEKIKMLGEFCIFLKSDDMQRLLDLKTREEVDRYAHSIIMNRL